MSKNSQRVALLLATVVPALLAAGCATGNGTQAMKGVASPATPTDTMMSPEETDTASPTSTDTDMDTAAPTDTGDGGAARSAVQGYFDALKTGNVDEVVGAFADDAWVAVDGKATATGTDAIRKLFQETLQGANGMAQATHTIEEARTVGGEEAIVHSNSRQGSEDYRELFVLTRDGEEWKIAEFMNNQT